jgi:PBSX family phage terminase large subunit
MLFLRWTMVSAHLSIIPEFVEKIIQLGLEEKFEITKSEIIHKQTGSQILFRGIKTSQGTATANLKSINNLTTVVIDEAEEVPSLDVFERIDLSVRETHLPNRIILVLNPSHKSHWIYKEFFEKKRSDTCYIHTTYLDNQINLSKSFIDKANQTKEVNPVRYRHLFLGEWLETKSGLLWTQELIDRYRINLMPELQRVVIAIDPATTANMQSDETGIVVAGKDIAGNCYVISDESGRYTPAQWGSLVAKLAEQYQSDCIVVESNQGGQMVEHVLRQYDKITRIKLVHAKKGKFLRAEPVFSLYEQGRVYHFGQMPRLEAQMVTFNPAEQEGSPDRLDALVYALTELSQQVDIKRIFAGRVI